MTPDTNEQARRLAEALNAATLRIAGEHSKSDRTGDWSARLDAERLSLIAAALAAARAQAEAQADIRADLAMEEARADIAARPHLLFPCPFCENGKLLELPIMQPRMKRTSDGFQVECLRCGPVGPHHADESQAARAWNRRSVVRAVAAVDTKETP